MTSPLPLPAQVSSEVDFKFDQPDARETVLIYNLILLLLYASSLAAQAFAPCQELCLFAT